MAKVIGIDLGTTNSVVAVIDGGDPIVIPNAEGSRITPSVVAVNPKNGERLVGQIAKRQAVVNAENTIFSIKRFMGRKFKSPAVQRSLDYVPYEVREAENGDVRVVMNGETYSPPEISAMILQKLKADAEAYLGEKVTQAVVTVPAYFNDTQRQATKDAGKIAGLEILRIINEPTASSLAYGLDNDVDENIAVYDLGGGTFDISIIEVSDGVFEVLATNGDTHLGGDDFDQNLIAHIVNEFQAEHGIDLSKDLQSLQRLKEAAEKAKIELSTTMQTEINLPYITADAKGPKHLEMTLTRAKFEQLTQGLIERSLSPVKASLKDAKSGTHDIDQVILVGGQTRMPAVQKAVQKLFGKTPHTGVNPDEVVAVGAAIQGGILTGEVEDILLLDVISLTLNIETLGGVATPLIPRNTTIPSKKSQLFSTASDGQTQVEIHVLQGERTMVADNKSLGKFILDNIPAARRGQPQIEVTFDVDANGILHVTAADKATGNQQSMKIEPDSGLSEAEIERIIAEAEAHQTADAAKKSLIETKNQAENTIQDIETLITEQADKLNTELKSDLEKQITAVRDSLPSDDPNTITAETAKLLQMAQALGEKLYQQAPEDDGSDVIDGEFEAV